MEPSGGAELEWVEGLSASSSATDVANKSGGTFKQQEIVVFLPIGSGIESPRNLGVLTIKQAQGRQGCFIRGLSLCTSEDTKDSGCDPNEDPRCDSRSPQDSIIKAEHHG